MKQWWLVIVLAVILIAFGVYDVVKPFSSTPVVADIIAGTPNATYTNSQLGFSLQYPSTATSSAFDFTGYLPLTQTPVTSFVLPADMSAGTNLGQAGVYIGATTSPSIVTTCATAQQNSGEIATTSATIGGTVFSVFTSNDAGAGNFYETKSYRAVVNGSCLEINETLHSGNIGNYTPGTVTEFDHAKFSGILDAIVQTYQSL